MRMQISTYYDKCIWRNYVATVMNDLSSRIYQIKSQRKAWFPSVKIEKAHTC